MLPIIMLSLLGADGFTISRAQPLPEFTIVRVERPEEKHPLDFKPVTVKVVPVVKPAARPAPAQKPRAVQNCANGQCGTMERRGLFGRRR